ncbi:MAG: thioredoxin domain-containing protein [Nitrospirae bacterium]|nr:thioredoxin domain-containing protein [Nitrospirota bacterium]
MSDAPANRLAAETSPYLLQHAHNPVDWYPWGEEALARARAENKPIFLSIGYSACHWCHVMAHESFEDPATAALMNEHFVNIKVDREERPDLDHIYQTAFQLLAGRGGGWPLSMFLTPELGPFWGGTYFPSQPRYGMPAFRDVLRGVATHFREKPEDVTHNVAALVQGLARVNHARPTGSALSDNLLEAAAQQLVREFDPVWGGFGGAPKFPSTMALAFLLTRWHRTGNQAYLHAAGHSLAKMAEGGIRDHLGGGFARYAVDEKWLVPHFEKMLYDNALLIPLYIDAHLATGNPLFAQVAREALDYVAREMTHPEGGFYAAQDADSEGEEGRFFVWRPGEIDEVLGPDADLFCACYGVTEGGNFEGQNILWTPEPLAEVAAEFGLDAARAAGILAGARAKLFARRAERVRPGLDDKVIASWNGLMLSAFARAAAVFGDAACLDRARRAADFVTGKLMPGGALRRCYKDGQARHPACLDDYVFLAQGLLDLHHASGDGAHLDAATGLMDTVLERFAAPQGGFYFTGEGHEELIARTLSGTDQSIPSGNSVAALCLLRLHQLTGAGRYHAAAEGAVRAFLEQAAMAPQGYANLLLAADALIHPPTLVALAGPDAAAWQARLARRFRPNTWVQRIDPARPKAPAWLAGKGSPGRVTAAYVCQGGTCAPPVTAITELEARLGLAD